MPPADVRTHMAIADIRKRATENPTRWQTCSTCELLDALDDSEARELRALLADKSVRYQWLADQLAMDGHAIDWQPLSRHARGICSAREKLRVGK